MKYNRLSPRAHPLALQFFKQKMEPTISAASVTHLESSSCSQGSLSAPFWAPVLSLFENRLPLAVVSAKQIGELSALSVDASCLQFRDRDSSWQGILSPDLWCWRLFISLHSFLPSMSTCVLIRLEGLPEECPLHGFCFRVCSEKIYVMQLAGHPPWQSPGFISYL